MERRQLESVKQQLRALRDRLAGGASNPPSDDYDRLAGAIDTLAGVVTAMVDDQVLAGEHANAVEELINKVPANAQTTQGPGHGATKGGSGWPEVERTTKADDKFDAVREIGANPDPRD